MNFWFGDETRSARAPEVIASFNINDAKIEKGAQSVEVFRRRRSYLRLIISWSAADVDGDPNICEPQQGWFAFAQNRSAKNVAVERYGTVEIGDNQSYRYDEFLVGIFCIHA